MPTLEDTVDFNVVTLNDLLDADVRTGVPVAADDRYKRWAFLATGAAVMLAIGLVVALVTGGSDNGGGGTKAGKSLPVPPDTTPVSGLSLGSDPGTIVLGSPVTILNGEGQPVGGGTVIKIVTTKLSGLVGYSATVAVRNSDLSSVNAAVAKNARGVKVQPGMPQLTTTTTTSPPPAAVPIQPAAPTTPTS